MTTVSFFTGWNMLTQQTWFGTTTGATSTRITITDGFHTGIYFGQFTYPSASDVQGVLQGFQQFNGTTLVENVTGANVDAHTANTLIANNQLQTLFQIGLPGNDTINGSSSNDVLAGYGPNTTFTGGGGNDTLIATGTGNTSVYSGASRNYTVNATSTAATVQDRTGTDGIDTLTSIQTLRFPDQTIDLSSAIKTAGLTSTQLTQLVDLYVAYFNRAPDAIGLDFWGGALKDGASLATLAAAFASSPEAQAAYPSTLSNGDFVTSVYTNVLGRNTDSGGFAFWVGQLQSGAVTKGNFVLNIIQSVLGQPSTAPDAQYIANKYTVGSHFALTQGLSDGGWAKTVMSGVNGTAASVTAANAQTDAFAAIAATSTGAEFTVKIVGITV